MQSYAGNRAPRILFFITRTKFASFTTNTLKSKNWRKMKIDYFLLFLFSSWIYFMLKQNCSRTESSLSRPIFFFDTQNLLPGKYFSKRTAGNFFRFFLRQIASGQSAERCKIIRFEQPSKRFSLKYHEQ